MKILRALIMSLGACASVVTPQAMRRVGIEPETAVVAAGNSRGIAGREFETETATFPALGLGQEGDPTN